GKPHRCGRCDAGLTSAVSPLALQLSALFQIKAQSHSQSQFMKSILLSAVALSFAVSVLAEEKPPQLKELKDKASYAIGLNVGFNFKRQNVDVNQDAFMAGFKDALSGRKPLMSEQEVRDTMMAFEKDMQQKLTETAQKNAAEAEKFLAANKTKECVKRSGSGLQYRV